MIALRVKQTEDLLELLCGDVVLGNALDNVQYQVDVRRVELLQVLRITQTSDSAVRRAADRRDSCSAK